MTGWFVFTSTIAVAFALPFAVAFWPGLKGLAYLPELDLLGWAVLILLSGIWLLAVAWLFKMARTCLCD